MKKKLRGEKLAAAHQHSADQRLDELFQSEIWGPLRELCRKENGGGIPPSPIQHSKAPINSSLPVWTTCTFEQLRQKCVAVSGDVSDRGLGLTDAALNEIKENVNIIMHCAATIDFDARLDLAVQLNIHGTIELFEIAQSCMRVTAFVHISTAYVNCNQLFPGVPKDQRSKLHEQIYPLPFNIDAWLKRINTLAPWALNNPKSLDILGGYPNTYSVTKTVTEHLLLGMCQRRLVAPKNNPLKNNLPSEQVPLVILRPSMIGSSHLEPLPGWIDAPAAVASGILAVATGTIQTFPNSWSPEHKADCIPVDTVVNAMLMAIFAAENLNHPDAPHAPVIASAFSSAIASPNQRLSNPSGGPVGKIVRNVAIMHSSSTDSRSIRWGDLMKMSICFFSKHYPRRRYRKPTYLVVAQTDAFYQGVFFLQYRLPLLMLKMSSLFNPNLAGQIRKGERAIAKLEDFVTAFSYFVSNEWVFSGEQLRTWGSLLSAEEKEAFPPDIENLDWVVYFTRFMFGCMRYILREDLDYSCVGAHIAYLEKLEVDLQKTERQPLYKLGARVFEKTGLGKLKQWSSVLQYSANQSPSSPHSNL